MASLGSQCRGEMRGEMDKLLQGCKYNGSGEHTFIYSNIVRVYSYVIYHLYARRIRDVKRLSMRLGICGQ